MSVSLFSETVSLSFPDEFWEWKALFESADGTLVEYAPSDETYEDWTEIFMVQVLPESGELTSIEHARFFVEGLAEVYYTLPIFYRLNSCDDNSFFLEWWCHERPLMQHEWVKMIKHEESVYLLRYTTRSLDQLDQARSLWEGAVRNAQVQ